MDTYIAGEWSLVQIVVVVIWVLLIRLATLETIDLEAMLRQGILDAMHAAHLSVQETAFAQRICERQWRKQLAGEDQHQISLTRLIRMPFTFWLSFGPALMALIYRKRLQEFAQIANDLKRGA